MTSADYIILILVVIVSVISYKTIMFRLDESPSSTGGGSSRQGTTIIGTEASQHTGPQQPHFRQRFSSSMIPDAEKEGDTNDKE